MRQKIKNKNKIKTSLGSKIFDIINVIVMFGLMLITFYPMVHILFASFSGGNALLAHTGLLFWPVDFSLEGYKMVFKDPMIVKGYMNTLFVVLVGSSISLVLTALGAYFLSRKNVMLQTPVMLYIIFTMFFSGGMIPTYLLIQNLGLYNNPVVLLVCNALVVYNMIIARSFFENTIPDELLEAAKMDGCRNTRFFLTIVLPLSKTMIAVIALYYAVMHWNSYMQALLYIDTQKWKPLQLVLRELLISTDAMANLLQGSEDVAQQQSLTSIMQYGIIVVSTLPMMVVFPFVQKYFVKGVMIGAVKG